MNPKQQKMQGLIQILKDDLACEKIVRDNKRGEVDVSLVNQFRKHDFIPNKWFNWVERVDAEVMIIGQDWGPYSALQKYFEEYKVASQKKNFDYKDFLFKDFSSRTEKFIVKTVEQTYLEKFGKFDKSVWDKFFFTMAVLYTRQGIHFRGVHNFDEKKSYEICYPYVVEQIRIVKPKVIMTLGGLGFKVVNQMFNLGYDKNNITEVIEVLDQSDHVIERKEENLVIIPNFHPASHTSPIKQKEIWAKLWDYID